MKFVKQLIYWLPLNCLYCGLWPLALCRLHIPFHEINNFIPFQFSCPFFSIADGKKAAHFSFFVSLPSTQFISINCLRVSGCRPSS